MIGRTVSRYRIVEQIGEGSVYDSEDSRLRSTMALKFLPEGLERDPQRLNRFLG